MQEQRNRPGNRVTWIARFPRNTRLALLMRILIADDNYRIREGIRSMLSEADHEVCGESADTDETVRLASELRPDVILLDVSMPGAGGLEAARLIHRELPNTKILVMSHYDPAHILGPAIEAGAQACIDKGRLGPDLLGMIEKISVPGSLESLERRE